jgi:hypothetical protein
MTDTTLTLTDADNGTTIGVPDGFLVNLTMLTPPDYSAFDAKHPSKWWLTLGGARDTGWARINVDLLSNPTFTNTYALLANGHRPYRKRCFDPIFKFPCARAIIRGVIWRSACAYARA